MAIKAPNAKSRGFFVNLYDASRHANIAHTAKITSTIMRNKKFFPVIKGKNIDVETTSGIKGIAKIPTSNTVRKIRFKFIGKL